MTKGYSIQPFFQWKSFCNPILLTFKTRQERKKKLERKKERNEPWEKQEVLFIEKDY